MSVIPLLARVSARSDEPAPLSRLDFFVIALLGLILMAAVGLVLGAFLL